MIRSMTGFGQASRTIAHYRVFIDMKSVNHRYCEVGIKIPKEWASYEDSIRRTILQSVKRGRVDVYVTVEREVTALAAVSVDWTLVDCYMQAAEQMKQRYGLIDPITRMDLLRLPELMQVKGERPELDEKLEQELIDCVRDALSQLIEMRQREGANLIHDINERLNQMIAMHRELTKWAPLVIKEYTVKLHDRIRELLQDHIPVDENRLAMEIAIFADRSNIDEELIRLQSHIQQFKQLLNVGESVGRKLDFLIQEMNREVNTIGSKANHAELSAKVIDMKAELEKIREQIQNIE